MEGVWQFDGRGNKKAQEIAGIWRQRQQIGTAIGLNLCRGSVLCFGQKTSTQNEVDQVHGWSGYDFGCNGDKTDWWAYLNKQDEFDQTWLSMSEKQTGMIDCLSIETDIIDHDQKGNCKWAKLGYGTKDTARIPYKISAKVSNT